MKKILSILNVCMIIIAIVGGVYLAITRDKEIGLILKDSSIIFTITAPYWVEKFFHKKISTAIKFICVLFIFSAHFIGVILETYNSFAAYDKIVHCLSGVVTAYLALQFLKAMKILDNKWFSVLFIISISLAVAAFWEMFEYTANIFFGGDAQRVALTGVNDTMQDIIVAFLGSIVVSMIYLFTLRDKK